ncbi:ribonuclease H-like domain-containing protein [Crassisporium funariophilum]|nr:ribonuclease H-like domain-containing protein [Crassisporium funariophilum]
MPAAKGPLWEYLLTHCCSCIEKQHLDGAIMELDDKGNPALHISVTACKEDIGGVLGVKEAMVAHLLGKGGSKTCPNRSEAQKVVQGLKKGRGKRPHDDSDLGSEHNQDVTEKPLKKKLLTRSRLNVFRGLQVPFTEEQEQIVVTLFLLFRAATGDVMPLQQQISDTLVIGRLKVLLRGKYAVLTSDGWKDDSRNAINGVNLSTYLVDLILATAHKKDGASMCEAFKGMVDKAEEKYGVTVVAVCCDNNGGSQRGRKDLVIKRPWMFGPPCCAHQFQLMLGDYFEENKEAAEIAEEATDLIGWVLNHGRVRSVFDAVQAETPPGKVLALLVANMTRWNTHFIAFDHLHDLKDSMQLAVISRKEGIISGQVGAEKNWQKKRKLEDDAHTHCDLIDDVAFWRRLKSVIDNLEPIYQALLTFAGIYLYFQKHPKQAVANGIGKQIEKWWKALDQPMFVLALVLNPFEGILHFGDKASVSPFTLHTVLLETYRRLCLRPPTVPRSEAEEDVHEVLRLTREREISEAFLSYLSGKGEFEDWEKNKAASSTTHSVQGDNLVTMWTAFLQTPSIFELADFAIILLSMSVNQAGLEQSFSDLKIKKTRLQNCLKLPKLEKMAKPIFEHLLEEEDGQDGEPASSRSTLVTSRQGWRKEMSKWVQEQQAQSDDDEEVADLVYGPVIFGSERKAYTEEAQLMELLADEEADEERIPDDGELEGSSNDFDGL